MRWPFAGIITVLLHLRCVPVAAQQQRHPGFVVRLNQRGVGYVRHELVELCKEKMGEIDWDGALRQILFDKFPLLEAKLLDFKLPNQYQLNIVSASQLYVSISPMDVVVMLQERFQLLSLLRPDMAIIVAMRSIAVAGMIDISSLDEQQNLIVRLLSCNVTIGWSRLKFINANVISGWMDNLSKTVHGVIEVGAELKVCEHIASILKHFNGILKKIPKTVPVTSAFNGTLRQVGAVRSSPLLSEKSKRALKEMKLDVSLLRPVFLNDKGVISMHSGKVSWKGRGLVPFAAKMMYSTLEDNGRMASLFVSDYLFNSLLYSLWERKFFDFTATKENAPLLNILQSTECPFDLCLADLLELMGIDVEPDYFLEFAVTMTGPPKVVFSNGNATVTSTGRTSLNQVGYGKSSNILRVHIETVATFQLQLLNRNTIGGSVIVERVLMRADKQSRFKPTPKELELFSSIAKTVLQVMGGEFLKQGISMPTFRGVRILNGLLHFFGNSMKMDFDFKLNREVFKTKGVLYDNL